MSSGGRSPGNVEVCVCVMVADGGLVEDWL